MTRRATFTAAELGRALKTASRLDPGAVVEVSHGAIRILPPGAAPVSSPPESESEEDKCDRHFGLRQ